MNAPADTEIGRWSPVVLALARELWVVRDRVKAMEQLLTVQGTLAAGAIDRYQPAAEQQAKLDHDCEEFVSRLVAELRGK